MKPLHQTKIPGLLRKHHQAILDSWLKEQLASPTMRRARARSCPRSWRRWRSRCGLRVVSFIVGSVGRSYHAPGPERLHRPAPGACGETL